VSLLPPEGWKVYVYPVWPEKIPAEAPIVVHWEHHGGKGRKKLLRFTHKLCGQAFHCIAAAETMDFPPGAEAIFDRHADECPAKPRPKPVKEVPARKPKPQTELFYEVVPID
jgi:hypothetical protein